MQDVLPQGHGRESRRGHEPNRIGARGLIVFAIVLFGTGIAIHVVLGLVLEPFAAKNKRVDSLYPSRVVLDVNKFPNPRLQEHPSVDLARMKAEERRRISAYGWVDRKAGIAHIPIERAMDILAKTGLPKVAAPAPVPGAPPRTFIPPGTKRQEPAPRTDVLPVSPFAPRKSVLTKRQKPAPETGDAQPQTNESRQP